MPGLRDRGAWTPDSVCLNPSLRILFSSPQALLRIHPAPGVTAADTSSGRTRPSKGPWTRPRCHANVSVTQHSGGRPALNLPLTPPPQRAGLQAPTCARSAVGRWTPQRPISLEERGYMSCATLSLWLQRQRKKKRRAFKQQNPLKKNVQLW